MLPAVQYSVRVPVSVDDAFHAFQDLNRFLNRGVYDAAAWVEGQPWQVGSRLRFSILQPRRGTISAVVTAISPPRSIDLIYHGLEVTGEYHVTFGPDLTGGTRIRASINLIGRTKDMSEAELHKLVTFLMKDGIDSVAAFCQGKRAESA